MTIFSKEVRHACIADIAILCNNRQRQIVNVTEEWRGREREGGRKRECIMDRLTVWSRGMVWMSLSETISKVTPGVV